MHQITDGRTFLRKSKAADVYRLFVNIPTLRSKNSADRVSGKHLRVFFLVALVELIRKSHDSIGATDGDTDIQAIQAGPPQSLLARENPDAITAELLFYAFAIEQYRL
jgi:hypothetical protein